MEWIIAIVFFAVCYALYFLFLKVNFLEKKLKRQFKYRKGISVYFPTKQLMKKFDLTEAKAGQSCFDGRLGHLCKAGSIEALYVNIEEHSLYHDKKIQISLDTGDTNTSLTLEHDLPFHHSFNLGGLDSKHLYITVEISNDCVKVEYKLNDPSLPFPQSILSSKICQLNFQEIFNNFRLGLSEEKIPDTLLSVIREKSKYYTIGHPRSESLPPEEDFEYIYGPAPYDQRFYFKEFELHITIAHSHQWLLNLNGKHEY